MHPTIYALSSGRPPAAIAIIRISGPQAFAAAAQLTTPLPQPRQATLRRLTDAQGDLLDEALVLIFPGPNTATGEDLVELHCHGSRAVIHAVLTTLSNIEGLRQAEPGEFTRRAFANGRIDLTEAEGLADLLEAETEAQRRAALAVAGGALRRQVDSWRDRLLTLSARAEAAIDYAGEEDETIVDPAELDAAASDLAFEIERWLAAPRAEPLRHGIKVVLAGPPNSGKSSLLNALLGEDKAIVSSQAGTTRDVIDVSISIEGIPLRLIDTAGLRGSADEIEQLGVARAQDQIAASDILLWLGDPQEAPEHPHLVRVHPRCDLPERSIAPPLSFECSATTRVGIADLLSSISKLAMTILPAPDAIALNRRQADQLSACAEALRDTSKQDIVLTAEALRSARAALDRLSGHASVEQVLDALFTRFCLGK